MTNQRSPSTKKSSLLRELASARKALDQENLKLKHELEQNNQTIVRLQKEIATLHSRKQQQAPNESNTRKLKSSSNITRKHESTKPSLVRSSAASKKVNNHFWIVPDKENTGTIN